MEKQVHGHDVMSMMIELNKLFTDETLLESINNKFGSDVSFYTCSHKNLTAMELITLLKSKGKFVTLGDSYTMANNVMCSH